MRIFEALYHRFLNVVLWLRQRATLYAQVALIENRRVLLVRRVRVRGWHLPGGGVIAPETPEATASRRIHEETGYELLDHPELVGIFPQLCPVTPSNYLVVFASSSFRKLDRPPGRQIAEVRWFELSELPADAAPACRKIAAVLID